MSEQCFACKKEVEFWDERWTEWRDPLLWASRVSLGATFGSAYDDLVTRFEFIVCDECLTAGLADGTVSSSQAEHPRLRRRTR